MTVLRKLRAALPLLIALPAMAAPIGFPDDSGPSWWDMPVFPAQRIEDFVPNNFNIPWQYNPDIDGPSIEAALASLPQVFGGYILPSQQYYNYIDPFPAILADPEAAWLAFLQSNQDAQDAQDLPINVPVIPDIVIPPDPTAPPAAQATVPEPSTLLTFALGLGALGMFRRRRVEK